MLRVVSRRRAVMCQRMEDCITALKSTSRKNTTWRDLTNVHRTENETKIGGNVLHSDEDEEYHSKIRNSYTIREPTKMENLKARISPFARASIYPFI